MHEDRVREFAEVEYDRLVRALTLFCGSIEVAEDAVQDALCAAIDGASAPNEVDSMARWVTAVAFNRARRSYRRRGAEQRCREALAPVGADGGDGGLSSEAVDVRAAVVALPVRQRQVVVLHYYLGWKVAMIAGSLSISESATKNALHKGRASLVRILGICYAGEAKDAHR